jgi:hypothetical protein
MTSTITLTKTGTRGPYALYTGFVEASLTNVPQTSVDIIAVTSNGAVVKSEFNKL